MRIIAGKYSSRRLETLPGQHTRPTLDKVKEAVFSSLGGFFDGGTVLDLYGGSGAIAFEALSRGMDKAYIVDKSRAAIQVIRKNAELLDCQSQCEIYPLNDVKALTLLQEKVCSLTLSTSIHHMKGSATNKSLLTLMNMTW